MIKVTSRYNRYRRNPVVPGVGGKKGCSIMLNKTKVSLVLLGLVLGTLLQTQAQDVYPGWAFYSSGTKCYLYDVDDTTPMHTWTSAYRAAGAAHLMRDSSVLFSAFNPDPGWSGGVLLGGRFQIITWDGEVVWDFNYSSPEYCPHHNFEIMYYTDEQDEVPHVMAACYEKVSGTSRLPDMLVEIKPTGKTTGEVVWEWHAWDHRTNDPDNHPELIEAPGERQGDWNHVNNVSYNRDLDQLVVDMKSFDEFIIIDHSTTTAEAASHSGGDYGMGGDLLYRWGQASNYGISGSDYIVGFHGGKWVPYVFPGTNLEVPGAGNVLIYHNDRDEIVEVTPPGDGDGVYPRDQGEAWGPSSPTWTHDINASSHEGSVMRLPNGNTFICDAGKAMYEVTPSGQEVWRLDKGGNMGRKYAYSYLDPQTYVKKKNITKQHALAVDIYSNHGMGKVTISINSVRNNASINIFTLNGKKVLSKAINRKKYIWNTKGHSSGSYIVKIAVGDKTVSKFVHIIE